MSHKIRGNNLVEIRRSKVALKLIKQAYIGIYILELGKTVTYESQYDCIKNKYDVKSKLFFTVTNNLMY